MKPMPRFALPLLVLSIVVATGCVSKKEHEQMVASYQQQLAACESEKQLTKEEESQLRKQMEREDARWQKISEQMGAVLPQMQSDMEADREKIINLVPATVRKEVASSLDKHFQKVTSNFVEMNQRMDGMRAELQSARDEIAQVRGATETVGEKVETTNTTVLADNARLQRELANQGRAAATLVAKVKDFDEKHLNCADCVDKLKMKDKSREALLDLHGELVKDLSALQAHSTEGTQGQ